MRMCVEVDLARPRTLETITTPAFVSLKQQLLVPLREASRRQLEETAQ
jgi:hypothetical protein